MGRSTLLYLKSSCVNRTTNTNGNDVCLRSFGHFYLAALYSKVKQFKYLS